MARWVWRLPGTLSPAWCPRFRKTWKSGRCQGRSCGDTETPHSQAGSEEMNAGGAEVFDCSLQISIGRGNFKNQGLFNLNPPWLVA